MWAFGGSVLGVVSLVLDWRADKRFGDERAMVPFQPPVQKCGAPFVYWLFQNLWDPATPHSASSLFFLKHGSAVGSAAVFGLWHPSPQLALAPRTTSGAGCLSSWSDWRRRLGPGLSLLGLSFISRWVNIKPPGNHRCCTMFLLARVAHFGFPYF